MTRHRPVSTSHFLFQLGSSRLASLQPPDVLHASVHRSVRTSRAGCHTGRYPSISPVGLTYDVELQREPLKYFHYRSRITGMNDCVSLMRTRAISSTIGLGYDLGFCRCWLVWSHGHGSWRIRGQ